jgi:hypothetical protein
MDYKQLVVRQGTAALFKRLLPYSNDTINDSTAAAINEEYNIDDDDNDNSNEEFGAQSLASTLDALTKIEKVSSMNNL